MQRQRRECPPPFACLDAACMHAAGLEHGAAEIGFALQPRHGPDHEQEAGNAPAPVVDRGRERGRGRFLGSLLPVFVELAAGARPVVRGYAKHPAFEPLLEPVRNAEGAEHERELGEWSAAMGAGQNGPGLVSLYVSRFHLECRVLDPDSGVRVAHRWPSILRREHAPWRPRRQFRMWGRDRRATRDAM